MSAQRLRAFQDMTGVELGTEIEIVDAPAVSGDADASYAFLLWLDDELRAAGPLRPGTRITAVATDGRRTPVTLFACNPRPETR